MSGAFSSRGAAGVPTGRVWVSVVVAATVLAGPALAQQAPKRPPTAIEAQRVGVEAVVETVHSIGTVAADKAIVVRPEIAGVVTAINFTQSAPVEKGQTLFTLDDAIYRAELQEVQARLNLSQRNYDRAIELFKRDAGTARARDETRSSLEAAQAERELVRVRLAKTVIAAPFSGIAGLTEVDPGEYVQVGQALVSLIDSDPVRIDFTVPERYLRFLAVDQIVRASADALPGVRFEGRVLAISPVIDPEGRNLSIRAQVPNPDAVLKPGMFARVDVEIEHQARAIMVPEQAIVPRGDKLYVFKVVEGVARESEVEAGLRSFGRVEIISGLAEGDTVVTAGQLKIRDGVPVRLLQPAESGG
jgi:membrane fusion protein (multidrug efflux system)